MTVNKLVQQQDPLTPTVVGPDKRPEILTAEMKGGSQRSEAQPSVAWRALALAACFASGAIMAGA